MNSNSGTRKDHLKLAKCGLRKGLIYSAWAGWMRERYRLGKVR